MKQVDEVRKLFTQLEELRMEVAENEKIEAAKRVKQEGTMKRIEQLFLEAEQTNQENKKIIWPMSST